ncbi:MAG: GNAT family N-acetyltransferase [Clostridia bacterium]|nr:GNAT family N-acetyltransferase [Clostridia bacterium]
MLLKRNLETPRLLIRPYQAEDRDFCVSLWCDKENGKYMSDPLKENIDQKYLSCLDGMEDEQDGYYLIAELKGSGSPVGTCCAFPEKDIFDIGYCISRSHWREGLGSEMLDALLRWIRKQGGRTVTCEVADLNAASAALLNKFGFAPDKATRYKKWGEETYFDAHIYVLRLTNEDEQDSGVSDHAPDVLP